MYSGLGRRVAPICLAISLLGCGEDAPTGPNAARSRAVPSNTLTSTAVSASRIDLTWPDNSTSESGYEVQRSATGSSGTFTVLATTAPNVTSFTDTGLKSSTEYCYRVRSFKTTGKGTTYSAFTNVACATTPASPSTPTAGTPTGLVATAVSSERIDLAWSDSASGRDSVSIERCQGDACATFVAVAEVGPNVTGWQNSGLTASTTYRYRVRAHVGSSFSSYSNTAGATTLPPGPPEAPSAVDAFTGFSTQIGVRWVDNSTAEQGFRVETSADGGATWTSAGTTSPNVTSSTHYGVTEQQACFRVIAFNALGESPPSNVDCATPLAGPTNLAAKALDERSIGLTWTDNSGAEDGYQVWRSTGIELERVVARVPANSTSYQDASVTIDVTYRYRVQATTSEGGVSPYSNDAAAAAATTQPAAPVDTYARPWSSSSVRVEWTDNSTNEDGFRVERSTDGGATWAPATSADPWAFVDAGLTSERVACYRVFAFNARGDSPPSNSSCTAPPAAPTDLATGDHPDGTEFTWRDNSSVEDGYELWVITTCEQSEYLLASLPPNTTRWVGGVPYVGNCTIVGFILWPTKDGGYGDPAQTW